MIKDPREERWPLGEAMSLKSFSKEWYCLHLYQISGGWGKAMYLGEISGVWKQTALHRIRQFGKIPSFLKSMYLIVWM